MSQQINNSRFLHRLEIPIEAVDADATHGRAGGCTALYEACISAADFDDAHIADELRQQLARASLLSRLTAALSRSLDPAEVLRTAVCELGAHLGVDRCTLMMHDEKDSVIRSVAQFITPDTPQFPDEYPATGLTKMIAALRQDGVLCFDDVAADARLEPEFARNLQAFGARSVMYAAVTMADETPAALALACVHTARQWSQSDVALVRAVADQTGVAIRQAQLFKQAEANARRERLINRLSDHIRSSLDLSEMLHTATHELGRALNASRVHLRPYNPAQAESHSAYAYTAPGAETPGELSGSYNDPIGKQLLRDNRIIVVDDAASFSGGSTPEINSLIAEQCARTGTRSEIICPLIVQGRFRGVLCIHQTDCVRAWTADEVALVETVAAQLATGMAQAELFEMVTRAKKEWEATFDAMSDGIFIFDNEKLLVRVNRAGATLEDSYPHLLLGRRCCDILRAHDGDSECVVERAIAEARSITLEVTPDHLQRPLLVTVEPILEAGRMSGVVCTVRDLSELREVQIEARQSQSLLMNILESAREAIFALDGEGRIQWCNSGTSALSGLRGHEMIGRNLIDCIFDEDRAKLRHAFRRALAGHSTACEVGGVAGDGATRFMVIDYTPLVIEGRTTGVLGIARDVTEQKQEREHAAQADKLRALGQLATGVAHDINNSLAAILGRTQLLHRATHNATQRQHLDIINTAAEDAAATVRRVQTFARQTQATEFELLDVRVLLHDAVEITRTRWHNGAHATNRPYRVELAPQTPAGDALAAMGIASELREIFVNLIVNALDAMPQGGDLTITGERAGERIRLHFTDTGTGMSADVRARIFEPFYTTKGVHGTGLGLFVSYGIVERHHGAIEVQSEINRGTTFTVELPAATPAPTTEEPRTTDADHAPALSVLVVDDEPFVRSTLVEILSALGHKVCAVESGSAARALLARHQFQVVMTDR